MDQRPVAERTPDEVKYACSVTSKCWNVCASSKNKEGSLTEAENDCLRQCAHRYLDVTTLITNNLNAQFLETSGFS